MADGTHIHDLTDKNVTCLFCGSDEVEMIGLFGAFHLASQYFCRACGNPFGQMRWTEETSETNTSVSES